MHNLTITLPVADGNQRSTLERYTLRAEPLEALTPKTATAQDAPHNLTRTAFAAAHVVADPLAARDPWSTTRPPVDWEATLAFRHFLWDQGLGLAEAMDTAQRGMGVDWQTAKELITRTMMEAKAHSMKPRVASGAGTDHAAIADLKTTAAITAAYETQMEAIEAVGSQAIIMASRALPAMGATPEDYHTVYRRLMDGASAPVILHWLGDMFDAHLKGYWGCADIEGANDVVLALIAENPRKVDGIKISLLNKAHEEAFRARLPTGVKLYTGDDFNYPALIKGDGEQHSHALLGIFAAIAPAAGQALAALSNNDTATFDALLAPTVPLAREIFKAPTQYYKAGIAFLAWLNGHQAHFVMPGGLQSARDITHYAEVFRLADKARLLLDPELATTRMRQLLTLHGVVQ